MGLSLGTRLGPYEILAPLGAGGMGEVYRARDSRLGREVAIKVLPEDLAGHPRALARFEREARAVAALSHPNILALFDVGASTGIHSSVTELLEGQTLRHSLSGGPFRVRRALDVAAQIAEALAAAHENGIVHRDLKPENVFLTADGRVKLLDFGLARVDTTRRDAGDTRSPTIDAVSEKSIVLGTVSYMSPEQARGGAVDFRSDQFSLGIVLYELLTGLRPFRGDSAAETMTAIIREEPEPLERAASNVPAPVRWIVERCLSKERIDRYESTRDLAREIATCRLHLVDAAKAGTIPASPSKRWSRRLPAIGFVAVALAIALVAIVVRQKRTSPQAVVPGLPGAPARIVVFPFENLGAPEDAYFASGMTEEITSRLANVRSLSVISRTTATQYDRKGKTVEQIGNDLGVGYVLEGSVRWDRSGGGPGRVRITPQLIRVSDDTHLWTDRYDRQLADIFAIQGDVADGVVRALNLTLASTESTALRRVPTRDLPAYDLYLRALDLEKLGGRQSNIAGQISLAGAAVERDRDFAEALALLARARLWNYFVYYDRRESEVERARVEAERAVALRPDSAETHLALGMYHYHGRLDYEAALAEFAKALELQPNEAGIHEAVAAVKRRQGKMEEAEAEYQKALSQDPRNATVILNLGVNELLLRKYPEAIRNLAIFTSQDPKDAEGYTDQAWAHLLWHGDVAAAELVLQTAAERSDVEDPEGMQDYFGVITALVARDWKKAVQTIDRPGPSLLSGLQFRFLPRSLVRGQVFSCMGRRKDAQESYEEARRILAAKISETPEDARLHSSLGITLAGVGQPEGAVREGERGVELMPPARDALRGIVRVEDLALIYTMVGNQEAALQQLDFLLSHPSWTSVPLFRLDPRWDPLRKNPKFEALLAKYDVKQ